MAHYAFLDENNIVTSVIVGIDEGTDGIDWEQKYGEIKGQTCKRTSYNTINNEHILGGTPFRGNFASIGMVYNEASDIFIQQQPYDTWVLNEQLIWEAPIAFPNDANSDYSDTSLPVKYYVWNEVVNNWSLVATKTYDETTSEWSDWVLA